MTGALAEIRDTRLFLHHSATLRHDVLEPRQPHQVNSPTRFRPVHQLITFKHLLLREEVIYKITSHTHCSITTGHAIEIGAGDETSWFWNVFPSRQHWKLSGLSTFLRTASVLSSAPQDIPTVNW
ncbi:hypothetical protein Bca4012_064847 [Brassica carinata]